MGNGYRFNVAYNGKHLFATDPKTIWIKKEAKELYEIFKKKFPESEGYEVSVTRWESIGHHVDFD